MNEELIRYVEREILPRYDAFDRAHRRDHALTVIAASLRLARYYEVNPDMVYAVAAYHDTGLREGRERHHEASARIVRGDRNLRRWFTEAEVATIAEAAEDHRASSGRPPRTIYGRIVAEADRVIDCETTLRRTVQYGLEHAPELDREGQFAVLPNICGRSTAKAGICVCGCPNRKTPPVWTSCVPLSATTGSCVCGSTNSTTTNFAARRDHCRFQPLSRCRRRSAGASEPRCAGPPQSGRYSFSAGFRPYLPVGQEVPDVSPAVRRACDATAAVSRFFILLFCGISSFRMTLHRPPEPVSVCGAE